MNIFLHYLKLAFRNILKYRAQNVICILSIALSATLLTVIWSLLREITPPEIYLQPYAEKVCAVEIDVPQPEGGYRQYDFEAMKAVEKMQLHAAERVAFNQYSRAAFKLTIETDGRKRETTANAVGVKRDHLRWYGYRSRVSGKPVPELADDEVIITQRLARQLFGKTDVIGETILMEDLTNEAREAKNYRIADVIHPSPFYRTSATSDLYYRAEEYTDMLTEAFYVQLRDGFTADDLRAELEKMFPTDKIAVTHVLEEYRNDDRPFFIIKNVLLSLLIAFLAISVVGFLRMKAQLFRIRQREIALRTVLGSKRRQLVALFSTEIALVLILALALTLTFNSLLKNYMGTKLSMLLAQIYWPMDDFTEISLYSYLMIAVVSIAVVWLVVRNIRRQQTGLAMQMKPSRGSAMSVATITFQILMSTIFVGITIGASHIILNTIDKQGRPANDSFYKSCYMLRFPTGEYADKGMELLDLVTHSENVDHLVTFNNAGGDMIRTDTAEVREVPERYVRLFFQRERELFDFFAVEPVITNPGANPQLSVFVSEELMHDMERGGTWQCGYIDIMQKRYDIAGYYGSLPYMGKFYSLKYNVVVTDPDHFVADPLQYQHIVVPKKGREREARREIETRFDEMYNEFMEGYTGFRLTNYREMQAPQLDMLEVLLSVFLIVAAISLISTVASLYSVISLDTRRRRKEVALRKIHGARTSVIAKLFAKRYIIICAVSFAILLPLVLGFFIILGADGENISEVYGLTVWTLYLPTVLLISLTVFLTVVWKIREVMHLKPAEWLKE